MVLRQRAHHSVKPDTWWYAWNSEDRLVAVQTPDGTNWTYRYDPLGRRIGKYGHGADGGVVERVDFTWDGPRLIETHHWRPDGRIQATTWDYRPNTFTPITQTNRSWLASAAQTEIDHRFHTTICDLVGTPTHLVDPDGNTNWHTQTTIWGTTAAANSGPVDCPLRFPGQYHDPETGHHCNNQRYYDPNTGRYLSKDPLGLSAGPNSVAYVLNPAERTDVLGLICDKEEGENRVELLNGCPVEFSVRDVQNSAGSIVQRVTVKTEADLRAVADFLAGGNLDSLHNRKPNFWYGQLPDGRYRDIEYSLEGHTYPMNGGYHVKVSDPEDPMSPVSKADRKHVVLKVFIEGHETWPTRYVCD